MKKILVAGAALAALAAAGSAHAVVSYPGFGYDPAGPSLVITINSAGVASIAAGPSSGPYDNVEDTYIGVENNYGKTIYSLHLSSPGVDLFGFDGDGIDGYGAVEAAGNPDGTGYGGPISYFTNIAGNYPHDSGDVNFFGGLASGGFTYFSLEEDLDVANFNVPGGGVTTGGVPEPATWAMMMVGIGAMGAMLRNSTRKNAVTA